MTDRRSLGEILRSVARAGALLRASESDASEEDLATLCRRLIDEQAEGSSLAAAQAILDRLQEMSLDQKVDAFQTIAADFGVDDAALDAAIKDWRAGDVATARRIHFAAEPQTQALIRALNQVPGATGKLVALRADLMAAAKTEATLAGLDEDFQHLFSSWFNRGFLELRRIDWNTSASILEKIIAYEAVHEIQGWDDLRRRVGDPDRRLFAFFHPAMPAEPLIFVQVALTQDIPEAIAPILDEDRQRILPETAKTAVFYSISNCQKGLRGISFGNFLIKQVVAELAGELPTLNTFVTLSPVPGLRRWSESAGKADDAEGDALARLAARYLTGARRPGGGALDPVAHFHLGNGAALHAIHTDADLSERGRRNSWGVMVNYLYDSAQIEARHHAYAVKHDIAASKNVRALAED